MGNRSNLYLQSSKSALPLFEANNSLPFFWLALLDSQTLTEKFRDWERAVAHEELAGEEGGNEEWPSANIVLSEQTFLENAARSHAFVRHHFPDCLPLFTDFGNCIKGSFKTAETLRMDITQVSAFYESTGAFCEALQREVAAIENNRPGEISFLLPTDLIAGGTGFATSENSGFAALPEYQRNLKTRSVPPPLQRPQKASLKSLRVALVVLLLCPVFSYGIYKGYLKEGLSGSVVAIALLNVLFYVFSLWALLANLPGKKD